MVAFGGILTHIADPIYSYAEWLASLQPWTMRRTISYWGKLVNKAINPIKMHILIAHPSWVSKQVIYAMNTSRFSFPCESLVPRLLAYPKSACMLSLIHSCVLIAVDLAFHTCT